MHWKVGQPSLFTHQHGNHASPFPPKNVKCPSEHQEYFPRLIQNSHPRSRWQLLFQSLFASTLFNTHLLHLASSHMVKIHKGSLKKVERSHVVSIELHRLKLLLERQTHPRFLVCSGWYVCNSVQSKERPRFHHFILCTVKNHLTYGRETKSFQNGIIGERDSEGVSRGFCSGCGQWRVLRQVSDSIFRLEFNHRI